MSVEDRVPTVTIVTPVYNEETALPLFKETLERVLLSRSDYRFNVVFVDDGSADQSWKIIRGICAADKRFKGLRLSRNFGANVADSAGLGIAGGDAVAVLACDLQDPPEVILEFLAEWKKGARIVWGRRRNREDELWRVVVSNVFFRLMRAIAMPAGSKFATGGFFLADRKVVEAFKQFQETNRIVFALVAWTGFDQAVVDYDRKERAAGVSGWTPGRMLKSMYDGLIGFSPLPVRLITLVGLASFAFTLALAGYLVYCRLTGAPPRGWTEIMFFMTIFFGIQFLLSGLMGEYLFRIHSEVISRPLFFIADQTGD